MQIPVAFFVISLFTFIARFVSGLYFGYQLKVLKRDTSRFWYLFMLSSINSALEQGLELIGLKCGFTNQEN